ncbi:MAG: mandelate racemase/muconate lactonizing enzyme family protein [Promethearchaeota archaeon]
MKEKISSVELTPLFVPFKPAVRKALGESEGGIGMAHPSEEEWLGAEFVIIKVNCNDGNHGLGESSIWLPESGITPKQVIDVIKKGKLAKYLIGENPFNVEKINKKMDINVARNEQAKGALDMALYDLMGKITNLPACCFMGGKNRTEIPLAALIPLGSPMLMKGLVRSYYKKGYRTFRLKLGKGIQEDLEIVKTIRKAFGDAIRIRVDYNQAYTPSEAIKAIKAIEPYNIDFVEQPVRTGDFLGMAHVQKKVNTPLMNHEDFFSMRDFISLVELGGARILGIQSDRPGGVTKALKLIHYARCKGLEVVIHKEPLGISSAMLIHLHAGQFFSIDHATELFGMEMMEEDLIIESLDYSGGMAKVPEKPGYGVELDEKALQKYATDETIIIE